MAIFSRQKNIPAIKQDAAAADNVPAEAETTQETQAPVLATPEVVLNIAESRTLVVPRLSEKAGALGHLDKYIFTIHGNMNKIELRKQIEKQYGVKIANVNMIVMQGKTRRFGRFTGRMSSFKKAIVTLTKDSKKINLVEPN